MLIPLTVQAQDDIFISEVADPSDDFNGRFVELFNPTDAAIDLSLRTLYLVRQANGGSTAEIQLTGTIAAGDAYVIATNNTNFNSLYGFDADLEFGSLTGNGDDGYFLYDGGGYATGILLDIYGEIDVDGTGTTW